jgi:chromosome segregation protein
LQFTKLRLAGFKSFVDPTELEIRPGVTGVVGPNGCGKSNLVEALRWVMGENSARRMRGLEMDDVLFNGTSERPARNLAEVTVWLDNTARTAPAAFNHADVLQVSRRLERGDGSDFKLNGRSVRARDVALLFQDHGSGAGSPGLVGQGRINGLIQARPGERRQLLEEAAGIVGLRGRRHEAELRLRAAEENLTRLDDRLGGMESQLAGLRRQARQAARYRSLSARIRKAEATVLLVRWQAAGQRLETAGAAATAAAAAVAARNDEALRTGREQAEAAAAIPERRQGEAEAGAVVQRLRLAVRDLETEEKRVGEAIRTAKTQAEQLDKDIAREGELDSDAARALARLAEERQSLQKAQAGAPQREAEARAALDAVKADLESLDARLSRVSEHAAATEADSRSLKERQEALHKRLTALDQRGAVLTQELAALEAETAAAAPDEAAEQAALADAERALATARTEAERAAGVRQDAESGQAQARSNLAEAETALSRLEAEAEALRAVLQSERQNGHANGNGQGQPLDNRHSSKHDRGQDRGDDRGQDKGRHNGAGNGAGRQAGAPANGRSNGAGHGHGHAHAHAHAHANGNGHAVGHEYGHADGDDDPQRLPLIDQVRVHEGYEAALGAALGDDLAAPLHPEAPLYWTDLPPFGDVAPLPGGVEPLAARISAPPVLARRLSHIGIVPDPETGRALAAGLGPGQQLVTRDGACWRWDGLVIGADAPDSATVRLRQRNRLQALGGDIDAASARVESARRAAGAAAALVDRAKAEDAAARQAVDRAFAALDRMRRRHAEQMRAAAARDARLASVRESLAQQQASRAETAEEAGAVDRAVAELPDLTAQRQEIAALKQTLAERRSDAGARRQAWDELRRASQARQQRLQAIGRETADWQKRADGGRDRLAELQARRGEAEACLAALAERPAALAAERQLRLSEAGEAEGRQRQAADRLAAAENRQAEADAAQRRAEAALAAAREAQIRADAEREAAETGVEAERARIAERLACQPAELAALTEAEPADALPPLQSCEEQLAKLQRERDGMGPVNLRAEDEMRELESEHGRLAGERSDLLEAIDRLRRAIGNLNKEARERLTASFDSVDGHFRSLFERLFGGGRARLELSKAEDPLEAGLEIFASPPGKKLQHLTLLSGGEQALTALALLFAVFLTNPAPICVLDEADAPLDDANVERFCLLLHDLAQDVGTRFLVITHHRMTMARADRLFGVTMAERGVSQLVSVDLVEGERLVDNQPMAA